MKFVLEGNCIKAFGKAIHALARIGDELWLDPTVKGLALRSVNSAHSAYSCFLFSPFFFQQYSLTSGSEPDDETLKCKLAMKSVLPLFRCLTSIERNVERCQIKITASSDRVIFKFNCRHGITKTHHVRYQESEALQAVFASHLCPNVLKAPARLLGDMVIHFPMSQEEITLSTTPARVSLRNYHEGGSDRSRRMCTEMSLHPDEFELFQVAEDSEVTFCLKELRGLLSFAESHSLPVSIHFGAAGKPVGFSVEDMVLEATVVLATLVDSESRGPSQCAETPDPNALRCADVSPLACEPQSVPQGTELVPSSQGSPIVHPPHPVHLQPLIHEPCDGSCPSVPATPASSTVCSLLFRALSSEQDSDGCPASPPVLVRCSDEEEEEDGMEGEDAPRSPSL